MKNNVSFAVQLGTVIVQPTLRANIGTGMARTNAFGAAQVARDIVRPARTRYMKSELDAQGHHHRMETDS